MEMRGELGREEGGMRARHQRPGSRFATLFIGLAVLCLSACEGGRTIHWKQEVKLEDGRILILERESKQGPHDPLLNIRMELVQRIAFSDPDGGERIQWEIPKGLLPAMLDLDGGMAYLVLRADTVADYNNWDCPNPPWLVYRYERKDWNRISMEQLPERFKHRNLLPAAEVLTRLDSHSADALVSVRELEQYWKQYPLPEQARTISREKVNANVQGCFPSVLERLGRANEITEAYGKGDLK